MTTTRAVAYGMPRTDAAALVRRAAGADGIRVRPMPVADAFTSEEVQPIVGRACTLAEVERLCRAAGYRMVRAGGLIEVNDAGELVITVRA